MGKVLVVDQLLKWGDVPEWAESSVNSLLQSLKMVDPATYAHCLRVGEYARNLAESAGLNEYQQQVAKYSGILHDIGKMGVPASITHKPDKLTDQEYQVMKSHPVLSCELIQPLTRHLFFQQVLPAVRGHHERVDGKGYPDKKAGDEIPLLARVILIVDTLDAMAEDRSYRKGRPIEMIYEEIKRCAGTQFDQQLAKTFIESHKYWQIAPLKKVG